MTTIKLSLSGSGISAAIEELKAYKSRVEALQDELPKSLGESARAAADAGSSASVTVACKPNTLGGVSVVARGLAKWHYPSRQNPAEYWVSSAALEEFGFGVVGKGTHPKAAELGYGYDLAGHGDKGWWYTDEFGFGGNWSAGEPAKGYMKNAAEQVRSDVISRAKELISR